MSARSDEACNSKHRARRADKTLRSPVKATGKDEISKVLQRAPYMTAPEVQAVLDVVKSPKGTQAKAEAFFDNSFLQKVEESGFINSLYSR
jgi:hypothetical protein